MSDFAGELCVAGAALVSPVAVRPAAHAFFMAAGATPAAGAPDGPLSGVFACPWIPADARVGVRMGVLAAQAVAALLAELPEGTLARAPANAAGARAGASTGGRSPNTGARVNVEVVVALPGAGEGITEEDVWLVERSVRTALHGSGAALGAVRSAAGVSGSRVWLDELSRAGRELAQDAIRLLVAVDSRVAPERRAGTREDLDSPWDPAPPRLSEAAVGLVLATPARAAESKLAVWGRIRGCATRPDDATPDNDVVSDGGALSEVIGALPGRSVFGRVVGPQSVSGFFRSELELAVVRNVDRFSRTYRPVCPAALLGDVGLAGLPAGIVLALAIARHGTDPRATVPLGPALVWDILRDGTRVAMSLDASTEPPPAHVALRALGRVPVSRAIAAEDNSGLEGHMAELRQACLERLLSLCRLRKETPWRGLPDIEQRILANLDALGEAGVSAEEVAAFCGARVDPASGFLLALVVGALEGDVTGLFEDTLTGLFGPEGELLLVPGGPESLEGLWLAAEGLFVSPLLTGRLPLGAWLDRGPPMLASISLVTLARNKAAPSDRVVRRLAAGERLFATALARVSPLVPEIAAGQREVFRSLLAEPGALAFEGARALLLAGEDTAVVRIRDGDPLCERLGARALWLLALAGHAADAPLFGRLARRLPRTDEVLSATGMFGEPTLEPMLRDAADDAESRHAATKALAALRAKGTWGQGGKLWGEPGSVAAEEREALSDREWQFRMDELRLHGKRRIAMEPGGFGGAARRELLVALGLERSGT